MNYKKYVAEYFKKTKQIAENELPENNVLIQFFQRHNKVLLSGMDECLELLKVNTDTSKYNIRSLDDGTIINNKEVVLELEGPYQHFGEFEGMIDGILARSTSVSTNCMRIQEAANNKPVIFMADRSDHYDNQSRDGYAASIAGLSTQVTQAHVEKHDGIAIGTVPHVLIQMFKGDILKAMKAYAKTFPNEKLTALVDFNNDVISDTLIILNEFGEKLNAIRVDTSQDMSDAFFKNDEEFGVTPNLIKALRKAMDQNGGGHVKIIVSSGFDTNKIEWFENEKAPVDFYGVGSSSINNWVNFSADAVKINGENIAKKGRMYMKNPKLTKK